MCFLTNGTKTTLNIGLFMALASCASRKQMSENLGAKEVSDLQLTKLPANYNSMTAKEKQEFIWNRTLETKFVKLPEHKTLDGLGAIAADPEVTMNHTTDTMPSEILNKFKVRKRVIHSQGVMAKVKFIPSPGQIEGYTGLLAKGSQYGMIRFSTVAKVGSGIGGVTPGIGLKFVVDGRTSPSLVAMYTLEGQGLDYNFFSNDLFTVVPPAANPGTGAIDKRFLSAVDDRTGKKIEIARIVSVEPFTEVSEDGTEVVARKTPRFLKFVANPKLKSDWGPVTPQDVREKLTDAGYISAGTNLYTVYACETFFEPRENCNFTKLGEIIADSDVVASRFGDKAVFFNHRAYYEKDFDKYPAPDGTVPVTY